MGAMALVTAFFMLAHTYVYPFKLVILNNMEALTLMCIFLTSAGSAIVHGSSNDAFDLESGVTLGAIVFVGANIIAVLTYALVASGVAYSYWKDYKQYAS